MKIKSLILSVLLLPSSIFAATNAMDNLVVKTSLNNLGSFASTNSSATNNLTTIKIYPRGATGDYVIFSDSGSTQIGAIQTNSFQGFALQTTNNGPRLSFRANQGLIMVTNSDFEVTGNTVLDGNVTFGNAAADTLTWNAGTSTMIGGHNFNAGTLVITNSAVFINTNSFTTTAALFIRGSSSSQSALIMRGNESPGSTHTWRQETSSGTFQMGGTSNGTFLIGAAQFTTVGINLLNASGDASIGNNTASTSATFSISPGTGITTEFRVKPSSMTALSVSSNAFRVNSQNLFLGTNSTSFTSFQGVSGNVIPGSIAANTTYTTNFALAGASTNGAYIVVKPPLFENVNLTYEAGSPSNGFVTIYIHNNDLVSAHTATNGLYGASGFMP